MIINTIDFGKVMIEKKDIIYFSDGIYAFEHIKEFVILRDDENEGLLFWLQAVNEEKLCFVTLNPFRVAEDYKPQVPADALEKLEVDSQDQLGFFVIAVIPENIKDITVNLKSPVVVNFQKNKAMQLILDENDYPVRFKPFESYRKADELC